MVDVLTGGGGSQILGVIKNRVWLPASKTVKMQSFGNILNLNVGFELAEALATKKTLKTRKGRIFSSRRNIFK